MPDGGAARFVLACAACTALFLRSIDRPPASQDEVPVVGELLLAPEFTERYTITRVLGQGGAGCVYLALDQRSGQQVAIKVMLVSADDAVLRRFVREGELLTSVQSPHVVRLLDVGHLPCGAPFLVSEFVPGGTLREKFRENRRMPIRQAIGYVLDVLSGLEALHAAGIIHRDMKPENVLIAADGRAKIADLGLARHEEASGTRLTATGAILGTPRYMSPEQARGLPATPVADLYATGVVLYELITGKTPFDASSYFELMRAHVEQRPQALRELAPSVSASLEALVARALSKRIEDRPQSAAEMRRELVVCARELDVQKRTRWLLAAAVVAALGWAVSTLELSASRVALLHDQGVALFEAGKPADALKILGEARSLLGARADDDRLSSLATFQGRAELKLGQLAPARAHFEEALAARERRHGPDSLLTSESWADLGEVELAAGQPKAAAARFERVLRVRKRELGPQAAEVADAQRALAMAELRGGDETRAAELLSQALAVWQSRGEDGLQTVRCLNALAWLEASKANFKEALAHYRRALEIMNAKLPGHADRASVLSNTAGVYLKLGDPAAAVELYDQALKIMDGAGLRKQPVTAQLLINVGDAYLAMKRAADAVPVLEEAVGTLRAAVGQNHPVIAVGLFDLGRAHLSMGRGDRAEAALSEAVAIQDTLLAPLHPDLLQSLAALAFGRISNGRMDEAAPLLRRLLAIKAGELSPAHAAFVSALEELAALCEGRGYTDAARPLYVLAAEGAARLAGSADPRAAVARAKLANTLGRLGLHEEAAAACAAALAAWQAGGRSPSAPAVPLLQAYAESLRAGGRAGEAARVTDAIGGAAR